MALLRYPAAVKNRWWFLLSADQCFARVPHTSPLSIGTD